MAEQNASVSAYQDYQGVRLRGWGGGRCQQDHMKAWVEEQDTKEPEKTKYGRWWGRGSKEKGEDWFP